jgi:hypothetical protein
MIFEYIHFGISLLVLILVGLIGFAVKNLKGVTSTLKDALESMKISAEYVKAVQEISKSLYNPHEIENLVKLRVEKATFEIRTSAEKSLETNKKKVKQLLDELVNELWKDTYPLGLFVAVATTLLPQDYTNSIIQIISSQEGNPKLMNQIVEITRKQFAEKGYELPVKLK